MAAVFGKKHVGEFSAHHQAQGITNTSNDIPSMPIHDKKIQLHFFCSYQIWNDFFSSHFFMLPDMVKGKNAVLRKQPFNNNQSSIPQTFRKHHHKKIRKFM